jgi:hypothetical protein
MMTEVQAGIVSWAHHHTAGSSAPVSEIDFGRFVKMEGGEYFFSPSIPALRTL